MLGVSKGDGTHSILTTCISYTGGKDSQFRCSRARGLDIYKKHKQQLRLDPAKAECAS